MGTHQTGLAGHLLRVALCTGVLLSAQVRDHEKIDFDYFDINAEQKTSPTETTAKSVPRSRVLSAETPVNLGMIGSRPSSTGVTVADLERWFADEAGTQLIMGDSGYVIIARPATSKPHSSIRSVWLQPFYEGIPLFGVESAAHFNLSREIVAGSLPDLPPLPRPQQIQIAADQAIGSAISLIAPGRKVDLVIVETFEESVRTTLLSANWLDQPIRASLVWFPVSDQLTLAWRAVVDLEPMGLFDIVVDAADGTILFSHNLVRCETAQGRVFRAPDAPHPESGPQTVETMRDWVSGPTLAGNNASVCVDESGRNFCKASPSMANLNFSFPFTDSYAKTGDATVDKAAALTNAFYWVNVVHNWLYELGFDEAAGNFQVENGDSGGTGGDAVRIDIHDGSAVGEANFSTPPDGQRPRMQLGLFPDSQRDAAFDADTIIHEYVHGLTARLVGGPSNTSALPRWQSGAMAEGWSDALAASFTDDPVIAEYLTRNFETGVRSVSYDQSPHTFGQFGTLYPVQIGKFSWSGTLPQVHRDGEIWATVLWDVREAIGKQKFERIVVTGLSMTPSRPSMLQVRDGILAASEAWFGPQSTCEVWAAFAKRGFGASAAVNPIQDNASPDTALSVYEAFDLPATCGGTTKVADAPLLLEEAEGSSDGWQMTGLWHITTRRAASGSGSFWFGSEAADGYETGMRAQGSLTSPEIDLTGVAEPVLEWDQYLDGEGFGRAYLIWSGSSAPYLNYDAGRLLISTNGGSTWSTLTHLAHNSSGLEFDHHRINLGRFAGERIHLRFEFDTLDDVSNDQEGWFVDNIRISNLTASRLARTEDRRVPYIPGRARRW